MIPMMNIIAWGNVVPWSEQRQVEQDLIVSRSLIAIFSDPALRQQLRIRGGTALNKLRFPRPLRYSEDIDLVRTEAGPIGPVLDAVRRVLEPWLGRAAFEQSVVAPRLRFKVAAEDPTSHAPIRLKVEINTREIEAFDSPLTIPFKVGNPWFTGAADIPTFSREEVLATKLRALLQRNKGRDLFDLDHGLRSLAGLRTARIVECFGIYLERSGIRISRAEAQQRIFAKLANPAFLTDMRPLVSADQAALLTDEAAKAAFARVLSEVIEFIPGEPWARVPEMRERFGISG